MNRELSWSEILDEIRHCDPPDDEWDDDDDDDDDDTMTESEYVIEFPPGSPRASEAGCTCPVIDNCHGKGFRLDVSGQPMYWMSTSCPIHGDGRSTSDSSTGR